ncbi:hypothetical protein [Streptomyces sp. NBC_01750]|uniref:hypothetical protein n=1 Tax=Streptomyces sp. NBC_01750 TaxID=2975928 RepID=UPI002DD81880|nr:hypothetical protein [Streptomyces sp. NBC_01750]WSD38133.1 hypothetical protein OG966_40235 [Streptomyces sp. NBC_01750]
MSPWIANSSLRNHKGDHSADDVVFLKPMPDFIVEKVEVVIEKTFTRLVST